MSQSSIGAKILVGATGLLLVLYLSFHLAGNVLLFYGPHTFNRYAATLISNPLTIAAEICLAALFVLHVVRALALTFRNRRTRPTAYQVRAMAGHTSRASVASATMAVTGMIVLLFVPLHVWMFRFGSSGDDPALQARDLYRVVVTALESPAMALLYVGAMVAVGMHLWHGGSSAFQSLGVAGPRTTKIVRLAGQVLAVAIAGGFIAIIAWVALGGSR